MASLSLLNIITKNLFSCIVTIERFRVDVAKESLRLRIARVKESEVEVAWLQALVVDIERSRGQSQDEVGWLTRSLMEEEEKLIIIEGCRTLLRAWRLASKALSTIRWYCYRDKWHPRRVSKCARGS